MIEILAELRRKAAAIIAQDFDDIDNIVAVSAVALALTNCAQFFPALKGLT